MSARKKPGPRTAQEGLRPGFEPERWAKLPAPAAASLLRLAEKVLHVEDQVLEPPGVEQAQAGSVEVPGSIWKELVDLARRGSR